MDTPNLSPSETRTLRLVARGELYVIGLDWIALQHLKNLGLVEERSTGLVTTVEGRRVLQRLSASS
jgi:hypothetical protein